MSESFMEIDHDTWNYGQPRLRSAGKITLPDIHGVLPFAGVRNPITASNTSHKVSLTYKTEINHWQPKVGLAESGAELAVAEEALIDPDIIDVEFQPLQFPYRRLCGTTALHTIDLRFIYRSGRTRFVFVRNAESLKKPWVQEEIDAIADAVPHHEAHEFVQVEADAYSRSRRENLHRMHRLMAFEPPDPVSDRLVEEAVHNLKTLWRISDLAPHLDLQPARIFRSCLRLIAAKKLNADMNAVICQHSRIWKTEL
ncbi:hypothetical protein [Paracoccus methylarcula]|uniref:TnsA endonuclease N-terminal domain-containing protein n=1 Tax=Paracoccus methylarcula TaxID=72022 RepID=A0A422QZB5_9RHOB|nr:hypothetical protein [Paracoccus methylarcula]RNF35324.1 hypothetical protein A7A09_006930 [Paracoccus methylarcula]